MKYSIIILILLLGTINTVAQTRGIPKKFKVTNINDGIVYFDEQPEYKRDKTYVIELHFSNRIDKIERKEPISLKLDDSDYKEYKNLNFEIPTYTNDKHWNRPMIRLDTVVAITFWDSTNTVVDINNPRLKICVPVLQYFRIEGVASPEQLNIEYKLHIPKGTFTDVFGNKSDEINVIYRRRKKP